MINEYRKSLVAAGRKPGTITQRVGDVERFAATVTSLTEATAEDLASYFAAHPGWKPEYRKKVTISLRGFYRWAHAHGYVNEDIALTLPTVRVPRAPLPPAPDDVILEAFEDGTLAERAIILLAATMALRRTEIASLHPKQRDGNKLTIMGKGDRVRTLTLDVVTLSVLRDIEALQGCENYYFPGRFGGHLHPCTVYRWVKRHVGEQWHLHSLRRRAAKVGFTKTRNIRAVQEFLGHESLNTTQLYINVTEDEVAAVAQAASLRSSTAPTSEITQSDQSHLVRSLHEISAQVRELGLELVIR